MDEPEDNTGATGPGPPLRPEDITLKAVIDDAMVRLCIAEWMGAAWGLDIRPENVEVVDKYGRPMLINGAIAVATPRLRLINPDDTADHPWSKDR